jgi:hypothetical protein
MIKLKDILLEMAKTDIHYENIMKHFNEGDEEMRNFIYQKVTNKPYTLEKYLGEMGIDQIIEIEEELEDFKLQNNKDTNPLEEACWDGYRKDPKNPMKKGKKGNMVPNCVRISEAKKKGKVNPAYLTKDAAAMKKEIDRVKKLKSDDPSAYEKWDADYSDKAKTKKYKTKKSAATSAYEKRFGKKEKVNEEKAHEKEMIDGIVDILKQVKDIQNRKKMAIDQLKDFKKEDISVDEKEFLKRCGL